MRYYKTREGEVIFCKKVKETTVQENKVSVFYREFKVGVIGDFTSIKVISGYSIGFVAVVFKFGFTVLEEVTYLELSAEQHLFLKTYVN